jgi:hypothetical protein
LPPALVYARTEIVVPIGDRRMGEVHRARDTRRDVAKRTKLQRVLRRWTKRVRKGLGRWPEASSCNRLSASYGEYLRTAAHARVQ